MNTTKSLAEIVAEKLIDYVIEEKLSVGDKLPNEFEIAKTLSVGRSTVREAVKHLIARNVLEVRQGVGTFIAPHRMGISEDPLGFAFIQDKQKLTMDLLEIRMALEPRIAALAASVATPQDIVALKTLALEVEDLISKKQDHLQADLAFHTKLAESSKNIVVPTLIPVIQNSIFLFMDTTHRKLLEETIQTHRMIMEAIASHDPIGASDAMILHIIYNRNHMREGQAKFAPAKPL